MSEELMEYEAGFEITDDALADWAVRKIAEANAEYDHMLDWYIAQQKVIKERHDNKVQYLTAKLQEYFATVPAKQTKTMSKYALPSGELVLNKAKQDFAAENPEALLQWCKDNDPALVRMKEEPAWSDIKKRLTLTEAGIVDNETGLVVDGVVELDKPEEFKIKVKGDN